MAKYVAAKVVGLREFQRDLAKVQSYEPAAVRAQIKSVAQTVVPEIISEMRSQFVSDPSRLDGTLEATVRASASASKRGISASILEGRDTKAAGYAGWWEFGGPSMKSSRPPNREFKPEGRAIFPVVKRAGERLVAEYESLIAHLAQMLGGA